MDDWKLGEERIVKTDEAEVGPYVAEQRAKHLSESRFLIRGLQENGCKHPVLLNSDWNLAIIGGQKITGVRPGVSSWVLTPREARQVIKATTGHDITSKLQHCTYADGFFTIR